MKEPPNRPMGRMWHLYKQGGIAPAMASMFDAQNAQQMAFIRSVMKNQRKNTLDLPMQELEVVVFDLETTGFSPYNGDEIISFGAVIAVGQQINEDQTYYSLVNPKIKIPSEIVRLTGITDQMTQAAPDLMSVLHNFLEFVDKRVLIAHGSGHDKHFLNSALWKTSRVNLQHRLVDTMMIAKWLHPKLKSYGLDEMLQFYGIEAINRHHALSDAIMTAQLWVRFLQEAAERQVITLGDLYAYLSSQ